MGGKTEVCSTVTKFQAECMWIPCNADRFEECLNGQNDSVVSTDACDVQVQRRQGSGESYRAGRADPGGDGRADG
jgi:hypothetical protein